MTDFEKYLGDWLLHSAEDHCSRCAFLPPNKRVLCGNFEGAQGPDDEVCLQGIRQYAEQRGFIAQRGE